MEHGQAGGVVMTTFNPTDAERLANYIAANEVHPPPHIEAAAIQLRAAITRVQELEAMHRQAYTQATANQRHWDDAAEERDSSATQLRAACAEVAEQRVENTRVMGLLGEAMKAIEGLRAHVSLVESREKQATEMCSWLTGENQRLRDVAALQKHLDDDIDEMMEDAEDAEVAKLRAHLATALSALDVADKTTLAVQHERDMARQECERMKPVYEGVLQFCRECPQTTIAVLSVELRMAIDAAPRPEGEKK